MTVSTIDWMAVVRMALVLTHVFAMAAAFAGIAFGDYAIFARKRVDAALLSKAAAAVTVALLTLWVTGLTIIWLDTHFDWSVLSGKPKLLAKLTIVTLLSINGMVLHFVGFTRLCADHAEPLRAARLPAVLGAISVVTWLYSAFAGLAHPLAPVLGYGGFLVLYLIVVCVAITVAWLLMTPRLAKQLGRTVPEHGYDLGEGLRTLPMAYATSP
jgi:hypothetical protein